MANKRYQGMVDYLSNYDTGIFSRGDNFLQNFIASTTGGLSNYYLRDKGGIDNLIKDIERGDLSKSEINSLKELVTEKTGMIESILPGTSMDRVTDALDKVGRKAVDTEVQEWSKAYKEQDDLKKGLTTTLLQTQKAAEAQSKNLQDFYSTSAARQDKYRGKLDDQLKTIEENLAKRRELNTEILDDAKRFVESPLQAETQYKRHLADFEAQMQQQFAKRGQGQTKDPISSARDIARGVSSQAFHGNRIAEKMARKGFLHQAKQGHLKTAGAIDAAGQRAVGENIKTNINIDRSISSLNERGLMEGMNILNRGARTASTIYGLQSPVQDLMRQKQLDQYAQGMRKDARSFKQNIDQMGRNVLTGAGTTALGAGLSYFGAPQVGIPIAGQGVNQLMNYRTPASPSGTADMLTSLDYDSLQNLEYGKLQDLWNQFFKGGSQRGMGGGRFPGGAQLPHTPSFSNPSLMPSRIA